MSHYTLNIIEMETEGYNQAKTRKGQTEGEPGLLIYGTERNDGENKVGAADGLAVEEG